MRTQARHWLAHLRRWRRAITVAVLPAFACSTVLASACFGMPTSGAADRHETAVIARVDHAGSTHAAHDSMEHLHSHADMPDCAHCPPAADDFDSAPTFCVTEGTTNANATQPSPAHDNIKLFSHVRISTLPATAAAPPPIRTAPPTDIPRVERTPLNIRYCVFLI